MIRRTLDRLEPRKRGVASVVGGMAALITGSKLSALALFGQGLRDLESVYRAEHPELGGDLAARWQAAVDFYDATHQDPTNRMLHVVGIPVIVGGALGLLAWLLYTPPWFLSAGAFGVGWVTNIVGHALFEKKAPAFADDPLAFVAGPVWDAKRIAQWVMGRREDAQPEAQGA